MIVPKGYYFYFGYDMLPLRPLFHPLTILMLLAILVFIAIIYYLGKYNKLAWFGGAWFFSTLLYASNLVMPVAGIIADRYAYIASLGFCMVLVVGVFWLSEKIVIIFKLNQKENTTNNIDVKKKKIKNKTEEIFIQKIPIKNKIAISLCAFICLIYMPFNFVRANQWKDIYTLLEADMPHLAKSYEAHRIASSTYIQKGMDNITDIELAKSDFQKGEEFVDKALAIYDGDALLNESKLIVSFKLGRNKEAVEQAKKIAARFDYSKISRDLLSEYYFSEGKYDSSALYYKELIRLIPEDISLYYKYTNVLRMANKAEEAVSFSNSIRNNKSLPAYLPDECIFYVYYYNNQMDQALGYFTAAYDKGLRNRELEYTIIDYYVRAGNKSVVETLKKKLKI
jgi:tetratricopeptide (TPR) repeat protein